MKLSLGLCLGVVGLTHLFPCLSQEKLEVIQEEHRAQLGRLQQKLTEAENKLSRLQQEKQQHSQQSIVRSRSPPDLALPRGTEERRPGEVGLTMVITFLLLTIEG